MNGRFSNTKLCKLWWNSLVKVLKCIARHVHLILQTKSFELHFILYKNHGMSLFSAFLGYMLNMQISIHIIEIEHPIDG